MEPKKKWEVYYEKHSKRPPTPLLQKLFKLTQPIPGKALELGAGTPVDSLFLLEQGFEMSALDMTDQSADMFKEIDAINFHHMSMTDFDFTPDTYSIISAQRSLPFIQDKDAMFEVIKHIKDALVTGGIFVGHLFGTNDEWNLQGKKMSFVDKEEFESLFSDMKVIYKAEREEDSTTANGDPKHWHVFEVIAIKQ